MRPLALLLLLCAALLTLGAAQARATPPVGLLGFALISAWRLWRAG